MTVGRKGAAGPYLLLAASWILALLLGCSQGGPKQGVDFSLPDLDGHQVSLAENRGKVVLVDFWATWCAPCVEEVPALNRMQGLYRSRGFTVLGLSMDDDAGKVRAFRAAHRMDYPVAGADLATAKAFGGVLGLPVLFIIGRDGSVKARHEGPWAAKDLQKAIEDQL